MGFHLYPCFLSPLPSKSFVLLNVPLQNEIFFVLSCFVLLWYKCPPDGLDVICPGVLAYRLNVQINFYSGCRSVKVSFPALASL